MTDIDREKLRELCELATHYPGKAIAALKEGRTQLDQDGVFVGVSRQALDEVIAALDGARATGATLLNLFDAQAAEIKKQHDMGHQAFLIGVKHQDRADALTKEVEAQAAKIAELEAENARLHGLINTPHTDDWLVAVPLEAAHQIERWSADHDAGKTPLDWFWLIGYLAQKVVHAADKGDIEKAKHHTISTGAALLNWWQQIRGYPNQMQPGIKPPEGEINDAA